MAAVVGAREALIRRISFMEEGVVQVDILSRIVSADPHCIAVQGLNPDGSPKLGPCYHDWSTVETVELAKAEMAALLDAPAKAAIVALRATLWGKIQASASRYSKATLKEKVTD